MAVGGSESYHRGITWTNSVPSAVSTALEFGALIGRHPRMQQVFVSAAASVVIDATLKEIIERKLMDCVRGPARARQRQPPRAHDWPRREAAAAGGLRETGGNQVQAV
jgi:hypothetical protein